MKILIAPDKFKGSLTAHEVATHLAAGLVSVRGVQTRLLPLADGGDGSVRAAVAAEPPEPLHTELLPPKPDRA